MSGHDTVLWVFDAIGLGMIAVAFWMKWDLDRLDRVIERGARKAKDAAPHPAE